VMDVFLLVVVLFALVFLLFPFSLPDDDIISRVDAKFSFCHYSKMEDKELFKFE
jgi:hypothetical protein